MEFTNLQQVTNCLKEWQAMRNEPKEVLKFLALGNQFSFKRTQDPTVNLHAYPGVSAANNSFYIFLIDASQDHNSSETALFNAITVCQVQNTVGDPHQIPEVEAKRRIDNWKNHFEEWATAQIDLRQQTQGIFKAFEVPATYMQRDADYVTFFGLKDDSSAPTGYQADLVTTIQAGRALAYYDTVRPVPPFDVAPESSFYLLSL